MKPFICTMPMRLDDGWNQIQFNLSDFTRRAYGASPLNSGVRVCGQPLRTRCEVTLKVQHARKSHVQPAPQGSVWIGVSPCAVL